MAARNSSGTEDLVASTEVSVMELQLSGASLLLHERFFCDVNKLLADPSKQHNENPAVMHFIMLLQPHSFGLPRPCGKKLKTTVVVKDPQDFF